MRRSSWIAVAGLSVCLGCASSRYSTSKAHDMLPVSMNVTIACEGQPSSVGRMTALVAGALAEAGYKILETDTVAGVVSTDWLSSTERISACGLEDAVTRRVRHDVKIGGAPLAVTIYPQTQYYSDPVWDWCAATVVDELEQRIIERLPVGADCETRFAGAERTTASEFTSEAQAAGDTPPFPIHLSAPRVPQNVFQGTMVSGLVTVRMLVDEEGRVRLAIPLGGSEQLRAYALEAAMTSRFQPAMRGDRAVAAWVCEPYDFRFLG